MSSVKWRNPHSALPRVRWFVQAAYLFFVVLVGFEFWRFYAQAVSGDALKARRPPAVEGFLPISALVGLRRLLLTGRWDDVHPAGLAIFVGAIASSLLARKAFCSWICPVGTLSRALEWAGRKIVWRRARTERVVPPWLDKPLVGVKYLVLGFFVWSIFFQMPGEAIDAFIHSPYNAAADAKMLRFFAELSATGAAVLGALVLLSLIVKNFWCRYLCPYGALVGLASALSPQRVIRDADTCNDCRACTRACPVEIQVHRKATVWTPECTGCLSCVAACTVPDCLTVTRKARRGLSPWLVPGIGVGTMLAIWGMARLTGHWQTQVPAEAFQWVYRNAHLFSH